jgi:hypothetical protein
LNGLVVASDGDYVIPEIAELSYTLADAMLEARAGKGSIGLPPVRARKAKGK